MALQVSLANHNLCFSNEPQNLFFKVSLAKPVVLQVSLARAVWRGDTTAVGGEPRTGHPLQVSCISHTLHPIPYTLHPAPYTPHPTPYNLQPAPYTLHPAPCTIHPAPCDLYLPCTLHPVPYALHPAPYTCALHPTPYTLHPTP